jgi:hypothetical protein
LCGLGSSGPGNRCDLVHLAPIHALLDTLSRTTPRRISGTPAQTLLAFASRTKLLAAFLASCRETLRALQFTVARDLPCSATGTSSLKPLAYVPKMSFAVSSLDLCSRPQPGPRTTPCFWTTRAQEPRSRPTIHPLPCQGSAPTMTLPGFHPGIALRRERTARFCPIPEVQEGYPSRPLVIFHGSPGRGSRSRQRQPLQQFHQVVSRPQHKQVDR